MLYVLIRFQIISFYEILIEQCDYNHMKSMPNPWAYSSKVRTWQRFAHGIAVSSAAVVQRIWKLAECQSVLEVAVAGRVQ